MLSSHSYSIVRASRSTDCEPRLDLDLAFFLHRHARGVVFLWALHVADKIPRRRTSTDCKTHRTEPRPVGKVEYVTSPTLSAGSGHVYAKGRAQRPVV